MDCPDALPHICKSIPDNLPGFVLAILGNELFVGFEIVCNRRLKSSQGFSLLQYSVFHNTDAKQLIDF